MRQRKHEIEDSLDRALGVFHRFGYRAATLDVLLRAADIGRGSLYYSFHGKHELFLAALERYRAAVVKPSIERLHAAPSPKAGIIELFDRVTSSGRDSGGHLGSPITNAAVELAPHDAQVRSLAAGHFTEVEGALRRAVVRAQELGEVSRQKDAAAIARGLLVAMQGLFVLVRAGTPRQSGRQAAAVVLDGHGGGVGPENLLG